MVKYAPRGTGSERTLHNEAPVQTSSPGNQLTQHEACVRPTPSRNTAPREAACRAVLCRAHPARRPAAPSAPQTHAQPAFTAALRDGGAAIPYLRTPPTASEATLLPPYLLSLCIAPPARPPWRCASRPTSRGSSRSCRLCRPGWRRRRAPGSRRWRRPGPRAARPQRCTPPPSGRGCGSCSSTPRPGTGSGARWGWEPCPGGRTPSGRVWPRPCGTPVPWAAPGRCEAEPRRRPSRSRGFG